MSLMTFSPETTILNISSNPELLSEYITAIFEGINTTSDKKLANDFYDILEKNETEAPEKMLSSFVYDTTLYFNQNPIEMEDSDPAYSRFKKAEEISKKFTKGKYQIINQENNPNPEDISLSKLRDLLQNDESGLTQKDILRIIINLYGDALFEEKNKRTK